jgi:putative endonuclease
MAHDYCVYILTDKSHSTLYIGITKRSRRPSVGAPQSGKPSFTQRYHCILLIYYEHYPDVNAAIAREKQLKGWRRSKKIALIEAENPRWEDLSDGML